MACRVVARPAAPGHRESDPAHGRLGGGTEARPAGLARPGSADRGRAGRGARARPRPAAQPHPLDRPVGQRARRPVLGARLILTVTLNLAVDVTYPLERARWGEANRVEG